jgi:hypothetical protein
LPIGEENDFKGVVDLENQAIVWDDAEWEQLMKL